MSTLQVGTIKSNAVSAPPVFQDSGGTEVIQGCTAWVNFNGTGTVAIRASFNVSSITDNGVGDYTVNFATAMANANYGVDTSAGQANVLVTSDSANTTTSSVRVVALQANVAAAYDPTTATVTVFGGK